VTEITLHQSDFMSEGVRGGHIVGWTAILDSIGASLL